MRPQAHGVSHLRFVTNQEDQCAFAFNYFLQVNSGAISPCVDDRLIANIHSEILAGFDGYKSMVDSQPESKHKQDVLHELATAHEYFEECCKRVSVKVATAIQSQSTGESP